VTNVDRSGRPHLVESEPGHDIAEVAGLRQQPEAECQREWSMGDPPPEPRLSGVLLVEVQGDPVAGQACPVDQVRLADGHARPDQDVALGEVLPEPVALAGDGTAGHRGHLTAARPPWRAAPRPPRPATTPSIR